MEVHYNGKNEKKFMTILNVKILFLMVNMQDMQMLCGQKILLIMMINSTDLLIYMQFQQL